VPAVSWVRASAAERAGGGAEVEASWDVEASRACA
jgi:hypothetical protein